MNIDPDRDPVPEELQAGDIVIEAGAYEGKWAAKVCRTLPVRMYAYEPATRAYKLAQKALAEFPDAHLSCAALGKHSGTALLCDINRDGANTFAYNPEHQPSEIVRVIDTAEAIGPLGEIGLMHLNAEGDEVTILERLLETGIIGRVKMILVQWHPYDDALRARIEAVCGQLSETHEMEHRDVWICWSRKEAVAEG